MRKYILLIFFTTFTFSIAYAQNYDKMGVMAYALNHKYTCDLLDSLGIKQTLPFGTAESMDEYLAYKKGKPEKIKKNKWFSGEVSYLVDYVVYAIKLKSKDFNELKQYLSTRLGEPRVVKYVRMSPTIDWANEYVYDVPDKYYISIRDNGEFSIYALDFMENELELNEFDQNGISYFNFENRFNLVGDDQIYLKPTYFWNKKNNYDALTFKIEYQGSKWMFLNKIDFLLDNNELLSYNLSPKRKIVELIIRHACIEKDMVTIPNEDWNKIIKSKKTKVRFTGENSSRVFVLNPIHIYAMKVASYDYEEKLFLNE